MLGEYLLPGLAHTPAEAALYHCDKHVVKMVLESAQLLSTAHRLLAGKRQQLMTPVGVNRLVYLLPGEIPRFEPRTNPNTGAQHYQLVIEHAACYNATHVNHPCAKWVRQSAANYSWLYALMLELDKERQHRFTPRVGKTVRELGAFLATPPAHLQDIGLTPPAQAMPSDCHRHDPIAAYRSYYTAHKQHIAKWSKRAEPAWFQRRTS